MANQINSNYIRGVDGLRAISILAVLAFHGLSLLKPVFGKSGWLGVDIFFCDIRLLDHSNITQSILKKPKNATDSFFLQPHY
ncbi:MAG: hypothetical protein J0H83_13595 [Candidatus Melainabacteria bacterium]|nr:hypothetical protein [Candidatus Melainabacteria bacterium]